MADAIGYAVVSGCLIHNKQCRLQYASSQAHGTLGRKNKDHVCIPVWIPLGLCYCRAVFWVLFGIQLLNGGFNSQFGSVTHDGLPWVMLKAPTPGIDGTHTEWCFHGIEQDKPSNACGVSTGPFLRFTGGSLLLPLPCSLSPGMCSPPSGYIVGCRLLSQQTGRWLQHNLAWVRGARGTWGTPGDSEGLGCWSWNLNKLPLLQKDPRCGANSWQCARKTELGIIDP